MARWIRWLRGLTALAVALFIALYVVVGAGYFSRYGCGEICQADSGWRSEGFAWQWQAQFAFALVAVEATCAGAIGLFRRQWRGAAGLYAGGLALIAVWAVWMF